MSEKTLCLLNQENTNIEKYLCELFGWSKRFYKDQNFPKSWSEDLIKVNLELSIPLKCLNHGKISEAKSETSKVQILEENDSIVALSKSEKIHSHPLGYMEEDNVLSILRAIGRSDLLNINLKNYDRSLLYRLDYETSGLMLAAKSDKIYNEVRSKFHEVMNKKIYFAKCHGKLKTNFATWRHYLKPKGIKGSTVACFPNEIVDSTEVSLSWKLVDYCQRDNISSVEIELHSGYRHQIRAQFSYEQHPLVGDVHYGANPASRLYLHAWQYELNLFGQKMHFSAPLPPNW